MNPILSHPKLWLIPFFLILAFAEFWFTNRRGNKYYTWGNTAMNLSIGAIDQVFSLAGFFLLYLALDFVYTRFSFWHLPQSWIQWVLAYIAVDFISYWFHRFSHYINILWAGHVTHHSSGHFNFTNGFRTSPFQGLNRIPFWLVLPVFGFSPVVLLITLKISGIFDFLQHTQAIPKLGWVEKVFITPSLHRVHHGKNELYLDKNFGSTFSIWDRMFGTYQEETIPVVFGIKNETYQDNDPWKAVFFQYQILWKGIRASSGALSGFHWLFRAPGWKSTSAPRTELLIPLQKKEFLTGAMPYCWFQLMVCPPATVYLLAFSDALPISFFLPASFSCMSGLIAATLVFYQNTGKWFTTLEFLRNTLFLILMSLVFSNFLPGQMSMIYFGIGLILLTRIKNSTPY